MGRGTGKVKPRSTPKRTADPGIVHGFRSGLEEKIAEELRTGGQDFEFEPFKIPFTPPLKTRTYTPDFVLPNGIIVETKGRFLTDDRQKHKHIKAEHPDLDVRFVFSSSKAKLSKGSPTTYAKWCEGQGFLYADKSIPDEWLNEPPKRERIDALERIAIRKK